MSEDIDFETGCWIDGHWGQYASSRLIAIAVAHGFNTGSYDRQDLDQVVGVSDDAEEWLNENIAPEGYSFGWYDGEFFLWSDEDWYETNEDWSLK